MGDHLEHDKPLQNLVARLHAGTTLRARVVRLRWKRRKRAASENSSATATPNGGEAESTSVCAEHEDGKQDDPVSAANLNVADATKQESEEVSEYDNKKTSNE